LFWRLIQLGFQQQFSYRAANLAGLMTNFFFGLLRASVMIALYAARTDVAGMSLQDAVTFTAFSQAIIAYLSLFNWWRVMLAVYSGEIASELLKPTNYFTFWLAQDIGRAIAHFLTRGLTIMAAYALFFKITIPQTMGQWLALAVTLVLSLLVSFGWRFLINLTAFWTRMRAVSGGSPSASRGSSRLYDAAALFPRLVRAALSPDAVPAMVNTLLEVYLGLLEGRALLGALAQQVLWVIALFTLCQLVMRAGVRKLVIQGG
jgi:ABC-2 type transport system permease protein